MELPQEVWSELMFSHLSMKDIYQVETVCHQWQQFTNSEQLWRRHSPPQPFLLFFLPPNRLCERDYPNLLNEENDTTWKQRYRDILFYMEEDIRMQFRTNRGKKFKITLKMKDKFEAMWAQPEYIEG